MIKKRGLLLLLLLTTSVAWSASSSDMDSELKSLLEQANSYFHQAVETANQDTWQAKKLYEQAAIHYEKIITDGGIRNGKLFYNTGNAYFRMGDIGRAILYYLKAEKYIPGDGNLIQNLEYARSKRLDDIELKEETQLLKVIFFWHYEIPSGIRVVLFTIFFAGAWGAAIARLFFKQGILTFAIILTGFVAVLFLGSIVVDMSGGSEQAKGVVFASETVARKGDSDTYQKSFQEPLHAGTEFLLIEERRGWFNIELADGRSCWIPAKDAGVINGESG